LGKVSNFCTGWCGPLRRRRCEEGRQMGVTSASERRSNERDE
jgi:hypothetical protein